jgi:hypothetical protein
VQARAVRPKQSEAWAATSTDGKNEGDMDRSWFRTRAQTGNTANGAAAVAHFSISACGSSLTERKFAMRLNKVNMSFWAAFTVFLLAFGASGPAYSDQAEDLVALANTIKNQAPGINFTIGTEKFTYNIAEPLYFTFTADKDCYVAIVDIGTSGKMTLLFPNKWHPDNRIENGKMYRIPPEGSDFSFKLTGPPGTEHVKVIASVDQVFSRVRSLQQEVKVPIPQAGNAFLTMKNPGLVLKDIRVAFSGLDPSKWATGDLTFQLVDSGAGAQGPGAPEQTEASGQPQGQ